MQKLFFKLGRVLAIDYGQKRTGFAVSDPLQICATPLETLPTARVFDFVKEYLDKEDVDVIVVGEAKQNDNTPSASARYIEPFVRRLKNQLKNVEIARVDERFTSKMAFQTILDAGLKKKNRQNKALVDKISATIILQSYLQQKEIDNQRNNVL